MVVIIERVKSCYIGIIVDGLISVQWRLVNKWVG